MARDTYSGAWWLPDGRERPVVGDLTFTHDEGPRLELRGILGSVDTVVGALLAARVETHPRVFGRVNGLEAVTLADCVVTRSQVGGGHASQTLRPRVAYVGASEDDPLVWRSLRLRMRHLLDWFGEDGVTEEWDWEAGRVSLVYAQPETLTVDTDNWQIVLRPGLAHVDTERAVPRWDPFVEFEVELPSPVSYSCFARLFLTSLQDFVTLAAGQPCWLTDVFVGAESSPEARPAVEVLAGSYRASSDSPDPIAPSEWLFTKKSLGADRLRQLLANWMGVAELFRAPRALLFEEYYRGLTAIENRFLLAAMAAETFHGLRFPGAAVVSDSEHQARSAEVLEAIPAKHSAWVAEAIKYSNRPSLRRRLKELVQGAEPVSSLLIPKPKLFVDATVQARNELVHRAHNDAASPRQLLHLTEVLRVMLQVWLLKESGFPPEELAGPLQRTRRFKNALVFGGDPDVS